MARWLNLELLDSTGTPFRQRDFTLHWDGGSTQGKTTAEGLISVEIPAGITRGTLQIAWRAFTLDFALPPAHEVAGAQARLNQLNFPTGPVDGVLGPKTGDALRRFQQAWGLAVTGALDEATAKRLVEEHGT